MVHMHKTGKPVPFAPILSNVDTLEAYTPILGLPSMSKQVLSTNHAFPPRPLVTSDSKRTIFTTTPRSPLPSSS
jgi:hypothetical protein